MNKYIAIIRTEVVPLLVILVLVTAMRSSLADHYHVPSGSMEYSLQVGDRLVVDKTAYGVRLPYTKIDLVDMDSPARGDVVIFDSPLDGDLLVKRVVAVGGDTVSLSKGRVLVNGKFVADPPGMVVERFNDHVATLNLKSGGGPDILTTRVPQGKLLVLGDHRGNSIDGRYFGFIDEHELYGRVLAVYYRRGEGLLWKKL